ncbi:MAG: DUF4286 family protein [Pseudomonadota bacterium]
MGAAPEILYEVVITVSPEIRNDYLAWLRRHMAQMLDLDGFTDAEMLFNCENENEITCHYRLRDQQAMQDYLDGPAKAMRADGVKQFGDKFSASRRILSAS